MQQERNISYIDSIDLKKITICQNQNRNTQSHFQGSSWFYQIHSTYLFSSQTLLTHIEIQCDSVNSNDLNMNADHHININNFVFGNGQFLVGFQIEASSFVHRGHYVQLLDSTISKDENKILINGAAFTHMLRIVFFVKPSLNKKKSKEAIHDQLRKKFEQNIKEINIYGITINSGPPPSLLTKLLNISQRFRKYNMQHEAIETQLLAALSLISARRFVQAAELLRKISKFYVQKYVASKSNLDFSRTTQKSWVRQGQEDNLFSNITLNNFSSGGRTLESNKFLQKAAKIQILLAQTILNPSLIIEKLSAYNRCHAYSCGNSSPVPLGPEADIEDVCAKISGQIIQFFFKLLSDKFQPYRVAALKSIQFFIETLGCYLSTNFILILKQVILTYPKNDSIEIKSKLVPYGLMEYQKNSEYSHFKASQHQEMSNNETNITKNTNKTLIDHYHHLLQTLLSIIGQINRKFLQPIFCEIIVPGIISKNIADELKLYLLRFSEKIIIIIGADLPVQANFVGQVLSLCQQKHQKSIKSVKTRRKNSAKRASVRRQYMYSANNRPVLSNLIYFSNKVLSLLKIKILPYCSGSRLQSIMNWINKTLTYLAQNQLLSNDCQHMSFVFTTILDFINSIYGNSNEFNKNEQSFVGFKYSMPKIIYNPIESLLYFINIAVHQNQQSGLPFERILDCLVIVLKYFSFVNCYQTRHFLEDQDLNRNNSLNSGFTLANQIVIRILQKSKINNLSLNQLKVLGSILEIISDPKQQILEWFEQFLNCIPHSTFDETYQIFDNFIKKCQKNFHLLEETKRKNLLKKIIRTLLDQYTVKGKAYQEAKQSMISCFVQNNQVEQLLGLCFYENFEPNSALYYRNSRHKKINSQRTQNFLKELPDKSTEHKFDSKSYKIDQESFIQKIGLTQLILSKIQSFQQEIISDYENQIDQQKQKISKKLIKHGSIKKFLDSIQRLSQSNILKIKSKALNIMKYFIEIRANRWNLCEIFNIINLNNFITSQQMIIMIKEISNIYKIFLQTSGKQSKLMYNILHNMALFFRKISRSTKITAPDAILKSLTRTQNQKSNILTSQNLLRQPEKQDREKKVHELKDKEKIYLEGQKILQNYLASTNQQQVQKTIEKQQYTSKNQLIPRISENKFDYGEWRYIIKNYQIKQFLKVWHFLNPLLNSPWQSIKQMFLLLVIEVFSDGLLQIPENLRKKSLSLLNSLLASLFRSSDSNERLGGLKIYGTLLGLRKITTKAFNNMSLERSHCQQCLIMIEYNADYLKNLTQKVYELIQDWNETICSISQDLSELTLTKQQILIFKKKIARQKKIRNSGLDNSLLLSFNFGDEIKLDHNNNYYPASNHQINTSHNLESLILNSWNFDQEDQVINNSAIIEGQKSQKEDKKHQIPPLTETSLKKIMTFQMLIDKQFQSKTEKYYEKESFLLQSNEGQLQQIGYEKAYAQNQLENQQSKDRSLSEDEQLQFEDLGIIEIDDEDQQWGEQQEAEIRRQIGQKLPSKKNTYNYNNKLSPNTLTGSLKPQRIRSKRYHEHEYQYQYGWNAQNMNNYKERIIVDQLEEKGENMIGANTWTVANDLPRKNISLKNCDEQKSDNRVKEQIIKYGSFDEQEINEGHYCRNNLPIEKRQQNEDLCTNTIKQQQEYDFQEVKNNISDRRNIRNDLIKKEKRQNLHHYEEEVKRKNVARDFKNQGNEQSNFYYDAKVQNKQGQIKRGYEESPWSHDIVVNGNSGASNKNKRKDSLKKRKSSVGK